MSLIRQRWFSLVLVLALSAASVAQAHLVVSQRGTLNIVGNGAYMALSLPVSALAGFDDNQDGLLSVSELRGHAASIQAQIQKGVSLRSDQGASQLEGLMLNTAPPDSNPSAPSTHMLILGRFTIHPQASGLTLTLRLFGTGTDEQTEQITVTRGAEAQLITLTPDHSQAAVLPSAWAIFAEQVRLGASHVLSGTDHLLFLLVVLVSAWRVRQVVLAMTCFTAGHAITLIACVWYGLSISSTVVEPAIAATIVGMAVFDRWSQRRGVAHAAHDRLALVFTCALIHGLGFAGVLTDLGLQGADRALGMAGFNVGIELGQLCVALPAVLLLRGVQQLGGSAALAQTTLLAAYLAMALGVFWFVERVFM